MPRTPLLYFPGTEVAAHVGDAEERGLFLVPSADVLGGMNGPLAKGAGNNSARAGASRLAFERI